MIIETKQCYNKDNCKFEINIEKKREYSTGFLKRPHLLYVFFSLSTIFRLEKDKQMTTMDYNQSFNYMFILVGLVKLSCNRH